MKDIGFIKALEEKGYKAYYVGGCVRDSLLGITSTDFDITTNALPEDILNVFPSAVLTGDRFGTVTVKMNENKAEITTMREEGNYTDSRHPDKIVFTDDIYLDLKRRDFTVNAIAWNENEGFIDPYNGINDIKTLTLRTVGEPAERFREDPLRILRGWRFCAVLGFTMEKETFASALKLFPLVKGLNGQTVRREIEGILNSGSPETLLLACGRALPDFKMSSLAVVSISVIDEGVDSLQRYGISKKQTDMITAAVSLAKEEITTEKEMKLKLYSHGEKIVRAAVEIRRYLYGDTSSQILLNRVIASCEPYTSTQLNIDRKMLFDRFKEKTGETLHLLTLAVIDDPTLNTPEKLIETATAINTKKGRPS